MPPGLAAFPRFPGRPRPRTRSRKRSHTGAAPPETETVAPVGTARQTVTETITCRQARPGPGPRARFPLVPRLRTKTSPCTRIPGWPPFPKTGKGAKALREPALSPRNAFRQPSFEKTINIPLSHTSTLTPRARGKPTRPRRGHHTDVSFLERHPCPWYGCRLTRGITVSRQYARTARIPANAIEAPPRPSAEKQRDPFPTRPQTPFPTIME